MEWRMKNSVTPSHAPHLLSPRQWQRQQLLFCHFAALLLHSRQQQRQLLWLLNLQERGSGWTIWARNRGLERKERAVSLICVELLEEVLMHNDSLETLEEKGLINPSGRERTLPLKVLGDGELSAKLNIKARSAAAAAKNLTRAEEYFAEKRAAAAASEPTAA
ncbi:hypothetical protein OIU78_004887 [Salix suchowensis]|nr:hypothetical protein OIU78_004887 [Salix suchowensis]